MTTGRPVGRDTTKYSPHIAGTVGNWEWGVRFDRTNNFIGITQYNETRNLKERVLLSPRQARELVKFIYPKKAAEMGL